MKKTIFILLISILFCQLFSSYSFENWFDAMSGYDDAVDIVCNDDFNKYFMVGNSVDMSYNIRTMNIICVDITGELNWNELYNVTPDSTKGIAICKGSIGIVALGKSYEVGGPYPTLIHFEDLDYFSLIDSTTIKNYDSSQYVLEAADIIPAPGGNGYFLTGTADLYGVDTLEKIFIFKLDNVFNIQWQYYYDMYSYKFEHVNAMGINDTIIGITGYVIDTVYFDKDIFTLFVDTAGNIIHGDIYNIDFIDCEGLDICGHDLPDHFGITGYWADSVVVIDLTLTGLNWMRLYHYENFFMNKGICIEELPDGNYVVGGFTIDTTAWFIGGLLALKLNSATGLPIWERYYSYNNSFPYAKMPYAVTYDIADSGIVYCGMIDNPWTPDTITERWDSYILKLDDEGSLHEEWWETYGGVGDDEFLSVFNLFGMGYLIAGYTDIDGSNIDAYMGYFDTRGEIDWDFVWGAPDTVEKFTTFQYDYNLDLYFLAGTIEEGSNKTVFMIYMDSLGNVVDEFIYSQNTSDYMIYDAVEVEDSTKLGGFILTGSSEATTEDGEIDIFSIYVDESLNIIWDTVYTSVEDRIAYSVVPDSFNKLGGFILTGSSEATTEDTISYVFAMKFDDNAGIMWEKTYFEGEGLSLIPVESGIFFITGYRMNDDEDLFLIGIDGNAGSILWEACPNLAGDQVGYDVAALYDTIIVSGYSVNSIYSPHNFKNAILMKFDTLSNYLGMVEYFEDGNQIAYSLTTTCDNSYVWGGFTDYDGQSTKDALFVKNWANHTYNVGIEEVVVDFPTGEVIIDFHNPSLSVFSDRTELSFSIYSTGHVEFQIFDLTGRLVKTFTNMILQPGYYSYVWDGRNDENIKISSGVYFCRLSVGNRNLTKKISLIE